MKIALVSPYDFAYPGGVVNHITCLDRELTRLGHDVRIIAPASKGVPDLGERFIPVGRPRPVPVSGSIARITLSPWLTSRVKTIYERENFDIVHLHEPFMPMLCTTFLRLASVPTVGTFHASGSQSWYKFSWYTYCTPLGKRLLRKWTKKLNGRVAVSPVALKYVGKYFPYEYAIIPNGINARHFHPDVPPIEEYNDGRPNIVFVGRMEKRKGVNHLLKAFQRVKKEEPDCRLIIVGPGSRLRKRYEKWVRKNGVQDVVFVGFASYEDLPRYYKTATVVCAPAIGWESFGIVLLEAMAVGKPIVASDIAGYASVVSHAEDGLLVPRKNARKLASALVTVLKDRDLQHKLGERGREKAIQYDWEKVTGKLEAFYKKIIDGSTNREEAPLTGAVTVK
jgi:phosphatidylinositol alpha-mannosyltransferase